jgi:5-methyltetrahydropteroyltriglutamate--homocysteine methyltransferase
MRRFLFMGPITETVAGIEMVEHGTSMPWASPEGETVWTSPAAVTSKLRKKRSLVCEEYSYARGRARLPLKVTVPSPLVLYGFWNTQHSTGAYADAFAMFADAAEVGRSEVQELAALGCEYIQVDAPELATLVDPRVRDWAEAQGMPAQRMLTEGIDLINGMVDGITGARLAIHLCRGNNAGMWMASGGYDYIASALFERATAFDAFLLEYDDPRSGSFEPLATAPHDKQIVLGLVTTKRASEDQASGIVARVDEAARSFPREQLGVSTQCGFASIAAGNPITEEDEERKLRLVAEVADSVWG